MTETIRFIGDRIYMDTNMTPEVFAKTRFTEKIREKGVLAELTEGKWNYNPWTFDETLEKDGHMILGGTLFCGTTVSDMLKVNNSTKTKECILAVCNALENAVATKAPLANIGAGGIIVSEDFAKILFLPYNLWTMISMSAGDENYGRLNGSFISKTTDRELAIRFTQAVLTYRTISGGLPFPAIQSKQREQDIIDGNYIPLKWKTPGVDSRITEFTERAFAGASTEFPAAEFFAYEEKKLSDEEMSRFKEKAEAALAGKAKMINSKRFVRAKQTVIIAASIAAAVVLIVARSIYKTSQEKPTSKSLSARQTVEMFYTAINDLNVDGAKGCTAPELSGRVDALSHMFITSRTRSMYDTSTETVNPAVWMIKNQSRQNIYGFSNFLIDGTEGSLLVEGPRKNTRPDSAMGSGEKKFTVEYNLLDTSGEDFLGVIQCKEEVSVSYKKDRWIISSINVLDSSSQEHKFSEFIEDYNSTMKPKSHEKQDVLSAIYLMSDKYGFLPTEHEIDEAYEYLKKVSVFRFE